MSNELEFGVSSYVQSPATDRTAGPSARRRRLPKATQFPLSAAAVVKVVVAFIWLFAVVAIFATGSQDGISLAGWRHSFDWSADQTIVIALASVLAGSFVAGLAGFAFSAIAGAMLFHWLTPIQTVPLLLACSVTTQLLSITKLWRIMQWRRCVPYLVGGVVGIPIGEALLAGLSPRDFAAGFGVLLICYSAYMLFRPNFCISDKGRFADMAAGFAGGITGGATAFPGSIPTIWCNARCLPKNEQRGIVQPFILVMQIATIAYFSKIGILTPTSMKLYLVCAPAVVGGTWLGLRLFNRINDALFRRVVLVFLLISGATLLL